jgi:hypothetical protein
MDLSLPASDPSLKAECACESTVLDGLSTMMGAPGHQRLNDQITELKPAQFKNCRKCVYPSKIRDIWPIEMFRLLRSLQIIAHVFLRVARGN